MSGGSQEGELPASREDQARPGGDFEDRDRSSRAVEAGDLPGGQTVRSVDSDEEGVVVPTRRERDDTTYTETDVPLTDEERRDLEAKKAAEAGPPPGWGGAKQEPPTMWRGPAAGDRSEGGPAPADPPLPWRQDRPPQRSAEPPPGTVAAGAGDGPPPPPGGGDPDDASSAGKASAERMYKALRSQRKDHPTQQLRPEVGGAAVRPPGARDAGTPAAKPAKPREMVQPPRPARPRGDLDPQIDQADLSLAEIRRRRAEIAGRKKGWSWGRLFGRRR